MARYTGPNYKRARRVGFSIGETGKELARRPYDNMEMIVKVNYLIMEHN